MSRIDRRKWTYRDIGYKSEGGIFDLLDNYEKIFLRLTDEEFEEFLQKIQQNPEEEELAGLTQKMGGSMTFSEKRKFIGLLNKYIKYD